MATSCIIQTFSIKSINISIVLEFRLLNVLRNLTVVNHHHKVAALQALLEPGISLKFDLIRFGAYPAFLCQFLGNFIIWICLEILRILVAAEDGWCPRVNVFVSTILLLYVGLCEELDAGDRVHIVFGSTLALGQPAHDSVVAVKDVDLCTIAFIELVVNAQLRVFTTSLEHQINGLLNEHHDDYDSPEDCQKATQARGKSRLTLVEQAERHPKQITLA